MPNPAERLADDVASRARGLSQYVARMERLYGSRTLSKSDVTRVNAGAFLAFQTYVERSLERLFLGALMGRYEFAATSVRPLVDIRSERTARAVVSGGKRYVDWLPLNDEIDRRAKAFLSGGRPFASVSSGDRATLSRMLVIRNALAHESSHAMRQFRRTFTEGKALPPDQLTPAGYLRGTHTGSQSRFDYLLADAVAVIRRMCT